MLLPKTLPQPSILSLTSYLQALYADGSALSPVVLCRVLFAFWHELLATCRAHMYCIFFAWYTTKYMGTSLIKNAPPEDPTVARCLEPCGGPRGGAVSHERGTPVSLDTFHVPSWYILPIHDVYDRCLRPYPQTNWT
jgi:hypothetical protein